MSAALRLAAVLGLLAVASAAAAAAAAQAAQAPRIEVVVDPRTAEVGELVRVVVTVSGPEAADCALTEVPKATGAELTLVSGPENRSSAVIVNGRVSRTLETTWRFQLVPQQEGTLALPPFVLECRGTRYESQRVSLVVTPPVEGRDVLRLSVEASAERAWVGQILHLDVSCFIERDVVDRLLEGGWYLTLPWFDGLDGLVTLESEPPRDELRHVPLWDGRRKLGMQLSEVTADGRRWIKLARRVPVMATKAGRLAIPPSSFTASIATEVQRQTDPFAIFGGSRNVVTRAVQVDATSSAILLDVLAPPAEERPASYTNAVGTFELKGAAVPRQVRVGDPITITLQLRGEGNLAFVDWPAFDELGADFRIFGKEESRADDVRLLAIEVSPKSGRVAEIPRLQLGVFDPVAGAYEVLGAGPFPIEVTAGANEGLTELKAPDEILNDLETIRETLPAPAAPGLPDGVWLLPGALLLLAVEARRRVVSWRTANPRLIARRGARRQLDDELERARDVRDVAVAFARFLSRRLGGPPAGLTAAEAAPRLHDAQVRADLERTVGGWEAAYLGGRPLELDVAREEARQLAERVEAVS